jgi:hypothetical protein
MPSRTNSSARPAACRFNSSMFTRERYPLGVKTLEPLPMLSIDAGGGAYLASFYGEEQRQAPIFWRIDPAAIDGFCPKTSAHLQDGARTGSGFR